MVEFVIFIAVLIAVVLGTVFIAVPLFAAVGKGIGGVFRGIGWLFAHVFGFIGGMLSDAVRLLGACIAFVVFAPFVVLNIVIARWSAAGHFMRSMKRECQIATACLYRIMLQRPLRFLLLGGLLEGIEDRFEEAVASAPPADKPSARTGKFDGYTIVGSLPVGGSGAKLYVAEPEQRVRDVRPQLPAKVVIKAFALTDGSSLPQIVRESRALEAAKQLGLVLDHGMDDHRFYYVMPYHDGDHLSIVARQLHGESDTDGLGKRELAMAMGYIEDLLLTLREYHRAGLWHKDVKPENIIVHDGRAHLVDLGLVTPLRSAMTLTTHGTEYFRDPEMVRQALRGVKVHQVDGTKFDIYAVGAVMYFLLENTFPAHGGLSRFTRKSPESLRWIVRRAMTDYNKRYTSVDLMLADIRHVVASGDPASVKPADLPSMRVGNVIDESLRDIEAAAAAAAREAEAREATGDVAAAAGSPQPKNDTPAYQAKGFAAGIGAHGPFMQIGDINLDADGNPIPKAGTKPTRRRPRLRVINWWTGQYVADEPLTSDAAFHAKPAARPHHVAQAHAAGRASAVAQRKAAQARAAAISQRAAARRARFHQTRAGGRHAHAHRAPSAFVGLVVMVVCIAGGVAVVRSMHDGRGAEAVNLATAPSMPGALAASVPSLDLLGSDHHVLLPLVVINDHPAKANPFVMQRIDSYLELCRQNGWTLRDDDVNGEARLRGMLPAGGPVNGAELPASLNDVLAELKAGGVLYLSAGPGDAPPHERLRVAYILADDHGDPPHVIEQTLPADRAAASARATEAKVETSPLPPS